MGIIRRSGLKRLLSNDVSFIDLVNRYDVVIMKHCFPASAVLEDLGEPDPSSERQSLENYKAIYRLLRSKFDEHPSRLFIVWTLPPLHRLFGDQATRDANAARATQFSQWTKDAWLTEDGRSHSNICVWDFRSIVMDSRTNFLKHEHERDHNAVDSHPNDVANNTAGPLSAQFIVDVVKGFAGSRGKAGEAKIVFLHHSTGGNVHHYPALGVPGWFDKYNAAQGTRYEISDLWYPPEKEFRTPWPKGSSRLNMPVDYYRLWLAE